MGCKLNCSEKTKVSSTNLKLKANCADLLRAFVWCRWLKNSLSQAAVDTKQLVSNGATEVRKMREEREISLSQQDAAMKRAREEIESLRIRLSELSLQSAEVNRLREERFANHADFKERANQDSTEITSLRDRLTTVERACLKRADADAQEIRSLRERSEALEKSSLLRTQADMEEINYLRRRLQTTLDSASAAAPPSQEQQQP